MTIVHVPDTVIRSAQRDRLPDEGAADQELAAAKVDESLLLHLAHAVAGSVLDGRQTGRERPLTGRIPGSRRYLPERFVRSPQVVDVTPAVEGVLHLSQTLPARLSRKHLNPERAMEALLFALGLGMVGPSRHDGDAQANEPGRQPRVRVRGVAAPGRTVVHQQPLRETVALAGVRELGLDGLRSLVRTSGEADIEARMIVQRRERVAPSLTGGEVALEVHLPEGVGTWLLEALPVALGSPFRREQVVSAEDVGDRRGRRGLSRAFSAQHMMELPAAPGGVLRAQLADQRFYFRCRAGRRAVRPAAPVHQSLPALLLHSAQPFVAGLPADAKAPTEGAHTRVLPARESHKLIPFRHGRRLPPGHRTSLPPRQQEVLPMSPHTCYPCLRSVHPRGRGET